MSNFVLILLCSLGLLSCSAASRIGVLHYKKMPVSYEFDVSKDSLEKVVVEEFSKHSKSFNNEYDDLVDDQFASTIFKRKDADSIRFWEYYYLNPKTYKRPVQNKWDSCTYSIFLPSVMFIDDHLDSIEVEGIGYSRTHFFKSTRLPAIYDACFRVEVDSIAQNRSVARIITIQPRIAIDYKTQLDMHMTPFDQPIWAPVEPSTIEEYEILLRIARRLGIEQTMPPIPNSFKK